MDSDKNFILASIILIALIASFIYLKPLLKDFSLQKFLDIEKEKQNLILKNVQNGIMIGDQDAPLTMTEYTSFLCPYCANFALRTLPQLADKYIKSGQLRLYIIIAPPVELGQASLCSQEQNRFLEYHDYLFENQSKINRIKNLEEFAEKTGMDKEKFKRCLKSKKYAKIVQRWVEEAEKNEIDGTPTFFIYPTDAPEKKDKIIGAQPMEVFEQAIEKYLAR